ncbi:MAG: hypothetical protein PWP23_3115 [Candidatus Sumerlaeota bacterium]|nr:hypothetical protein [Candidatus Sumerlaeota bacterium]
MKTGWLLALAMVPGLVLAQPTDLVQPHGREFVRNGQTYTFIGVNMRGLSHYGAGSPLNFTTTGHIDENLNGAQSMGVKVIRLFAANKHQTNASNIARLKDVLDKMEARDQKAIITLTDFYNTGFNPPGDEAYFLTQSSGGVYLDDSWFAGGFRTNYLPWVRAVVTELKDHNAVFSWQIGNELTDLKTPNNIIAFAKETAAEIKAIDPYHMVSTGFLAIDHTQVGIEAGVELYNDPNIDFITGHSYNGDDPFQNWSVQARIEKPFVLSEFGWDTRDANRPARVQEQLVKWIDQRQARGFMQWGYQAQANDIGDGDSILGMDRYAHGDYTALFNAYSARAAALTAKPPASLDPPAGENVALGAVAWQASSNFSTAYNGAKAFDGVVSASSKWTSDGSTAQSWLALDLGDEYPLTGFILRMANDAAEDVRYAFPSYELQTGTSLAGPWTTRFTGENPAQYAVMRHVAAAPIPARYVRLLVTDAGIDNYARLPEFEVYARPAASEQWIVY